MAKTHEVGRVLQRLGGVKGAVKTVGYSEATWRRWNRAGRIKLAPDVFRVADATGADPRKLAAA